MVSCSCSCSSEAIDASFEVVGEMTSISRLDVCSVDGLVTLVLIGPMIGCSGWISGGYRDGAASEVSPFIDVTRMISLGQ